MKQLLDAAAAFRKRLETARAAPVSFPWYPYDSMTNIAHVAALLGDGGEAQLRQMLGSGPVADIGCGDGDLAFFLESLGYEVDAFDNPITHHNHMRGVEVTRERLGSRIRMQAIDIDQAFALPRARYGLVLLLGVLYHVKNPYYVLEKLARSAQWMLLSTRVTASAPGIPGDISRVSVAYFLGSDELNADNSNYWILTRSCLDKLLERTYWRVERRYSSGASRSSDPTSLDNDERVFLLLRSVYGETEARRLRGWHDPENEGWRWTERVFAIERQPAPGRRTLRLRMYLPELLLEEGSLELEAFSDGKSLGKQTYDTAGEAEYARLLPDTSLEVEFRLNRAIPPREHDNRELGVIVYDCRTD